MPSDKPRLVAYSREYLERSWVWLNDAEVKRLTMTPDFSREDQVRFFESLPDRDDYRIWGVELAGVGPIGAAGIKHIQGDSGEYWGYIGEKEFWGRGLGTRMLADVESEARELGLTSLMLTVSKKNLPAIKLYRRAGYSLVSEDDEIMNMTKSLSR